MITTNYRAVFGACEVHGISQEDDGSILDRYKVNGYENKSQDVS